MACQHFVLIPKFYNPCLACRQHGPRIFLIPCPEHASINSGGFEPTVDVKTSHCLVFLLLSQQNHRRFLDTSGIRHSTSVDGSSSLLLFNGMLFSGIGMAKLGGFQETVFTVAMEQIPYFQQAAYEGRLYEGLAVADLLAADGFLVSRVNHRLLSASPPLVNKFSVGEGSDDSLLTPFVQFGQLSQTALGTYPSSANCCFPSSTEGKLVSSIDSTRRKMIGITSCFQMAAHSPSKIRL